MLNKFIERPVLASVIAIIITLVGSLAIFTLPVAQYPQISPPTVNVSAVYTGADASTVEQTVAAPIEEQINGAEDMIYMNSISSNDGRLNLSVYFEIERDLDLATVDVQNRLALAQPKLPQEVTAAGVSVKKKSPDMLMAVNLVSSNPAIDTLFMNNYVQINIYDALRRVNGVGDVMLFGDMDYSMRIWLNPDKLAKLGLTVSDVISAVKEQNLQAPAGQVGQPPAETGQEFQMSVRVKGRLTDTKEFEDIIIRSLEDGSTVRVSDVARVELGSKNYSSFTRLDSERCSTILLYQLPGANALDVANRVKATLKDLSSYFPEGMSYNITYDNTRFVSASMEEVLQTLGEALLLVFLVVFIFLQNFRATIIPMVAVPVSLIGTFAFFQILGFSINTLTLFGCVLAIGIVVDDAIVVVEAVQRLIDEEDMSPMEATKKAMSEVAGPVIATTLVLISVFVPVAFMGGMTGRLYQQFALTLAVSVAISSINALTLSPALSALLLRKQKPMGGPLGWFFGYFNKAFDWCTKGYTTIVRHGIRYAMLVLLTLVVLVGATGGLFSIVPSGFVPDEDQGYFMVNVQLPEGASLERTDKVCAQVEDYLSKMEGVNQYFTLGGFSLLTGSYSSYNAFVFAILDDWSVRTTPQTQLKAMLGQAQAHFSKISEAQISCFNAPAIPGLSATGGIQFELQDRGGAGVDALANAANQMIAAAMQRPEIAYAFTPFSPTVPQIFLNVDREKARKLGVPIDDIFTSLQTLLGGYYVNDFNKFGRTYRVMLQADSQFRREPADIGDIFVRNNKGEMAPLSTLTTYKNITGPEFISRFNVYKTVELTCVPAPGYSSDQAITALREVAATTLPQGFGYDWAGAAYQEITSSGEAGMIFGLALLMVFLVLAAQYESWIIPLAVVFAVPLGVFGAILSAWLTATVNNVYAQIGLVMLIGLAVKNAILIVEFAQLKREEGMSIADAALEASHLRFRPILMTSFAFILGVWPLVVADGAGASARNDLGIAVFGGMLAATILGVLYVPVLFSLIRKLADKLGMGGKA